MNIEYKILGSFFCLLITSLTLAPVFADEVVTLESRSGVTQSFLLLEPNEEPKGIILMFPGHKGVVKFKKFFGRISVSGRGGFTASKDTYVTYRNNGMVVALVAPPSDMRKGMDTAFRSSEAHLTDIYAVISYLNRRYQKAPYLHGHCLSSLSAASVATKLNNKGISGLILSSPRSRGRLGAVTDYKKDVIRLPVLLIQHIEDPCKGTPYRNLEKIKQFYESSSQKVDVIVISGGDTSQVGPTSCQNRAHAFHGLQKETASAVARWTQGEDFQRNISD